MAKTGGVLNAICAKLLKGNLEVTGAQGQKGSPGQGHSSLTLKEAITDHDLHGADACDTDKENNNTATKPPTDSSGDKDEVATPASSGDKNDVAPPATPSKSDPTPEPATPTVTRTVLTTQPTEGKRNKRKSGKPRNIVEFRGLPDDDYGKDELDEFELNNQDVDFNEIYKHADEDEMEDEQQDVNTDELVEQRQNNGALDLSGNPEQKESAPCSDSESMDRFNDNDDNDDDNDEDDDDDDNDVQALDLSVMRNAYMSANRNLYQRDDRDENSSRFRFSDNNYPNSDSHADSSNENESHASLNLSLRGKDSEESRVAPEAAASMKNYAKNTMSELLSMYGLGDEAESITRSLPLHQFQSVLQQAQQSMHLASQAIPSQHQNTDDRSRPSPKIPQPSSSASSSPKPNNNSSNQALNLAPAHSGGSVLGSTGVPPDGSVMHSALANFVQHMPNEGMYAKFVESFSKLAKLPQGKTSAVSKFATSSEYVKACFNPSLAPKLAAAAAAASGGKALLPDYNKYIKRFASYEVCGGNHCRDMSYKEHYHCMDCSFRVFVKKEEMIRHFKWHKKRDESLQHGFMRYSPMDDCSKKFGPCTHNSRQTHYHCLQPGCNKVYISTSDTQMHANYHRKDSAIIQEGFQRFRATEDCGTQACSFYGQRTTHFHCRRPGCNFTFKNKADMEKHKAYHQKDEILGRDGFKKFMKYEHCRFPNCRYSKQSNHIHCIRPGCEYVLHSTGQLYSHKRRHERRDFEHAYRRFKDEQKGKKPGVPSPSTPTPVPKANPLSALGAQQSLKPAHSNQSSLLPNMAPAHTKLPLPSSSTGSSVQGASATHGLNLSSTGLATSSVGIKQESEYIDLEDLTHFNRSQVSSPDMSMTPTDLSMSGSSASSTTSPTDVKKEPALGRMTPAKCEAQSVGLDLSSTSSSNKPQPSTLAKLASKLNSNISLNGSLNLPIPSASESSPPVMDSKPTLIESKPLPPPPSYNASNLASLASPGVAGFVPKSTPAVNDKREKDESWKKYLTRYTANDPCHPRCQFLYKDHYHCNIEGCGMIFRNKDGVREHARYHEQQDRITVLSYKTVDSDSDCLPGCQLSKRVQHYHCLWADCGAVFRASDPPFTRLEHHKIHEYTRAASSRQPRHLGGLRNDQLKRRRGRPPKYPKTEIPVVPKVVMSETEIANELRQSLDGSQNTLLAGFKRFQAHEACPDDKCIFIAKSHFHCVRPRCHHATDRADVLNLHAKDFHSYINILEGFEFFDRTVNCRRPHCHNNKANKHFHCVRPRCDYSFVRYSTMAQHDKKHKLIEMGKDITQQPSSSSAALLAASQPTKPFSLVTQTPLTPPPPHTTSMLLPNTVVTTNAPTSLQQFRTSAAAGPASVNSPDQDKNVVKTAGTFFPLTSMPGSSVVPSSTNNGPVAISVTPSGVVHASSNAPVLISPTTMASSSSTNNVINIAPKPSVSAFPTVSDGIPSGVMSGMPLTMLLQQRPATQNLPQLSWPALKMKMHYGVGQNCGRPFCKLKKKDHFHCFECNQAFSDPARLKGHVLKHGVKVDDSESSSTPPQPFTNPIMSNNPLTISPTPITIAPIEENDDEHEELQNLSEDEEDDYENENSDEPNPSSSLNLDASAFTRLIEAGTMRTSTADNGSQLQPATSGHPQPPAALDLTQMCTEPSVMSTKSPHHQMGDNTGNNEDNNMEQEEEEEAPEEKGPRESLQPGSRRSCRKRTATRHDDFVDTETAVMTKQRRMSSPKQQQQPHPKSPSPPPAQMSVLPAAIPATPRAEEVVPEGYRKYRFTEDCGHERCAYRLSSSHYHCQRTDCHYAFTDRFRINQHTEKHERIDKATGEEFKLVSAGQECNLGRCNGLKNPLHYHCVKCDFICNDTSKVLTHRKQHMRQDV